MEGLGSVGDLNQTANTLGGSNADISPTKGITNATGASNIKISNQELGQEEQSPKHKVSDKRKADTDARNEDFELMLRARAGGEITDFKATNV